MSLDSALLPRRCAGRCARRLLAGCALVLLASFAGCYRWQPAALGPEPTPDVHLSVDSTQVRYESAILVGDTVVLSARDSAVTRVAFADIDGVEHRDFDWITTGVVGLLIATGWLCIYPGC